jgi:ubiquinone biosynthesis monooxygenase Coq7
MRSFPGHPSSKDQISSILRVNLAGEYGAKRIYEGQLRVLKNGPCADSIAHMKEQELVHLKAFESWVVEHHTRPTLLHPLWHVAGYALGVATALLGEKAAMACTVAVEEVIDTHYENQLSLLGDYNPELKELIYTCQQEEREHRDLALDQGALDTPSYPLLAGAIKTASRLAIWLSERV